MIDIETSTVLPQLHGGASFPVPRNESYKLRAVALRRKSLRQRLAWGIPLWIIALAFLLPFAWMISTSLKNDADAYTIPMQWIPASPKWSNYADVLFGSASILPAFGNSFIVAAFRVVGELLTASLAGYAFARLKFRGRDKVFLIYLGTAIIPAQLLLVPRFIYFQNLGLYDHLGALILPGMFTVLGTFLMRQYFVGLPAEYADAARTDGASEWVIFRRIYFPMAGPVLSALGILSFVWSWNDYESPLVLISSPSHYTLPLALTNFVDATGTIQPGLTMAAAVLSILPIFVVFLVLQKRFVQAMSSSGLK